MQSYQRFQHIVHTVFNTSGTNGPCSLSWAKAGTHATPALSRAHSGLHGETGGVLGGGGITTLGAFHTVRKPCVAGCQNGVLCRFWGLVGGAPKERREPAGQRCAYARRCPAGVAAPLGCVIFFCFCRNCGLYALFQILLSVFQTLQLVLFLCKPYLSSFLFGSELFKGFRFCHCA